MIFQQAVVFAHQPHDRFSAAGPLQTSRSIEVEKRTADVIAIVALLSSYCLVVHLESEQLSKMPRFSDHSKFFVSFINCFLVNLSIIFHQPMVSQKLSLRRKMAARPSYKALAATSSSSSRVVARVISDSRPMERASDGETMGNNGDGWENDG